MNPTDQTPGKIECFHQTLKRWLTKHPAGTVDELNILLATFTRIYNH